MLNILITEIEYAMHNEFNPKTFDNLIKKAREDLNDKK